MTPSVAVEALAALAQDHRLAVYRALVQAGDGGLAAGAIADALGLPPSSLSFHLAQMERAGLIGKRRAGRSLIYSANFAAMTALIAYLTENCCGSGVACAPACAPASSDERSVA